MFQKLLLTLANSWRFSGFLFRFSDWLPDFTWKKLIIGALLMVVTFVVATSIVTLVVVKLPATYFHPSHDRDLWSDRHRAIRWTGLVIKNLGGLILVLLGIAMSLPGVPGPGVLTILFGIMLLDFPGKRRLEYKLVSHPRVLKAINQVRQKYDSPPLEL
ncbi:MAG: hypothetical protein ACXW3C_16480 [Pyrinomonadaceae bacterium]